MSDRETASMLGAVMAGRELGDFHKCPICGEYSWSNVHKCPPTFYVRNEYEDPEDAQKVRADTPEKAAERYWERLLYQGDGGREGRITVFVRDATEAHEWTIDLSYELVPSFTSEITKTTDLPQEDPEDD